MMVDKRKNKKILFLGSLFVAFIFLSGIASLNNNNGLVPQANTTTTIRRISSVPVSGYANVVVLGYPNTALLRLQHQNGSVVAWLNSTLSSLENNGLVSDYYLSAPGEYQVLFSNQSRFGPYSLQQNITGRFGMENAPITVNANSFVLLPPTMQLYVGSQEVTVYTKVLNRSMQIYPLQMPGSSLRTMVFALVAETNGTVLNITLSQKA